MLLFAEKILNAVHSLMMGQGRDSFSEHEIAEQLGLSQVDWQADYAAVLSGMLCERPADAPDSGAKYREVFDHLDDDTVKLTEYGKDLIAEHFQRRAHDSDTIELPRVDPAPDEEMDGLRAWQATVVQLWSNSADTFAELSVGWMPEDSEDAPWIARLYCGDRAREGWIEDVQIIKATSIQQGLQRLWDRAKARHGLFKDDARLAITSPTDYPLDRWVNTAERVMLDRAINTLKHKAPKTAMRFTYQPDRRPGERWLGVLHPFNLEPPEGILQEVNAATFAQAINSLIHEMDTRFKTGEFEQQIDPALLKLMEAKTDVSLRRSVMNARKTLTDGESTPDSEAQLNTPPDTSADAPKD